MFAKIIFASLTTLFISTAAAQADIIDRINTCENSGGSNGCVYDLLRELASRAPGGNPVVLPTSGAYRQTETTALCNDQFIAPVVSGGGLTALRLGWCGASFNEEYPCTGNICSAGGTTVEIISSSSYRFTNNAGDTAVFRRN